MQVSSNKAFNATTIRMELAFTTKMPVVGFVGFALGRRKQFPKIGWASGHWYLPGVAMETGHISQGKPSGPWLGTRIDQPRSHSKAHLEIDPARPFLMSWLLGLQLHS